MILLTEYPQFLNFEQDEWYNVQRFLNLEKQQYEIHVDFSTIEQFKSTTFKNNLRIQTFDVENNRRVAVCLINMKDKTKRKCSIHYVLGNGFQTTLFLKCKFNFEKVTINSKPFKVNSRLVEYYDKLVVYE